MDTNKRQYKLNFLTDGNEDRKRRRCDIFVVPNSARDKAPSGAAYSGDHSSKRNDDDLNRGLRGLKVPSARRVSKHLKLRALTPSPPSSTEERAGERRSNSRGVFHRPGRPVLRQARMPAATLALPFRHSAVPSGREYFWGVPGSRGARPSENQGSWGPSPSRSKMVRPKKSRVGGKNFPQSICAK
jgi:hypothetical protein